jgi:hypothetical protein
MYPEATIPRKRLSASQYPAGLGVASLLNNKFLAQNIHNRTVCQWQTGIDTIFSGTPARMERHKKQGRGMY